MLTFTGPYYQHRLKAGEAMHLHRRQLIILSIATIILTVVIIISSLVSFVPLFIIFAILLIAISLLADGMALHFLFRQQEALLQIVRGVLLLCLFFIILINFLLKRF